MEAKTQCKALDSTLITIASGTEQKFLSSYLVKHRNVSGNVWIGLEYNNGKFSWMDGTIFHYQNWDENSVKDGNNKCVDMFINDSDLGQWMDDNCNKKYLIACQKKQATKTILSEEVKNLTNVIEKQQNEIKSHQSSIERQQNELKNQQSLIEKQQNQLTNQQTQINSQKNELQNAKKDIVNQQNQFNIQQQEIESLIPIGFLYTQLPEQSSPQQLWPSLQWTEVTQSYAGLFFRAAGGSASSYGSLQSASSPHLTQIIQHANDHGFQIGNYRNHLEQGIETKRFYTGSSAMGSYYSLSFKISNDEVRPINKAIRIWKRTR